MKIDVTKLPLGEALIGFILVAVVLTFVLAFASTSGGGIGEGEVEGEVATEPSERGREIVQSFGCAACHSTTGEVIIGPSWLNLVGRTETLVDGTEVLVDEAYIRESILSPAAKVVQGFDPIMPSFSMLTDEDIQNIIAYMQSLSDEQQAAGSPTPGALSPTAAPAP